VQAGVSSRVTVEQVAVVHDKNLDSLGLIVTSGSEQRCTAILVLPLNQILNCAKFAEQHAELSVAVRHCMVQSVATSLVHDVKLAATLEIDLQEGDVTKHRCLDQVSLRTWLHFLRVFGLGVLKVLFAFFVILFRPFLQEEHFARLGSRVEVNRIRPLVGVGPRNVEVEEAFLRRLDLPVEASWVRIQPHLLLSAPLRF